MDIKLQYPIKLTTAQLLELFSSDLRGILAAMLGSTPDEADNYIQHAFNTEDFLLRRAIGILIDTLNSDTRGEVNDKHFTWVPNEKVPQVSAAGGEHLTHPLWFSGEPNVGTPVVPDERERLSARAGEVRSVKYVVPQTPRYASEAEFKAAVVAVANKHNVDPICVLLTTLLAYSVPCPNTVLLRWVANNNLNKCIETSTYPSEVSEYIYNSPLCTDSLAEFESNYNKLCAHELVRGDLGIPIMHFGLTRQWFLKGLCPSEMFNGEAVLKHATRINKKTMYFSALLFCSQCQYV